MQTESLIYVSNCSACGQDHAELPLHRMPSPVIDVSGNYFTHVTVCPITGQELKVWYEYDLTPRFRVVSLTDSPALGGKVYLCRHCHRAEYEHAPDCPGDEVAMLLRMQRIERELREVKSMLEAGK